MYFSNQTVQALPSYFGPDTFHRIVPTTWVAEQEITFHNVFTSTNYSLNFAEG